VLPCALARGWADVPLMVKISVIANTTVNSLSILACISILPIGFEKKR
jgi:hypothetical protein